MSVLVEIDHTLGDFHLHAAFSCGGRLTALFGQSGSGKTSIVNAIAGLLRPAHGRIVIDGVTLTDTQGGVFVPTHRRHIGYVFQESRLFPHMNVQHNLLYSQWFGGRKGSAGASFEAVVDMLGIGGLLRRYPSHLSGGEKQRVAIGRALLSHPRVLLMDEPLASLDDARKQEILPYIERLRDDANIPIIYVSHSAAEVSRLADLVVVMEHGAVVCSAPPRKALAGHGLRDADANAAMNVLDVHASVAGPDGLLELRTGAGAILAPAGVAGAPARIGIRAGDIVLALDAGMRTSALNVLEASILSVEPHGAGSCRIRVRAGEADIVADAPQAFVRGTDLREGARIYLLISDVLFL